MRTPPKTVMMNSNSPKSQEPRPESSRHYMVMRRKSVRQRHPQSRETYFAVPNGENNVFIYYYSAFPYELVLCMFYFLPDVTTGLLPTSTRKEKPFPSTKRLIMTVCVRLWLSDSPPVSPRRMIYWRPPFILLRAPRGLVGLRHDLQQL
jgi:hypothetical protein